MATKTTKKQVLTVEQRYELADWLANSYKSFSKDYVSANRRTVFGVIINTPNKDGETMVSKLGEEVATHVTNLTINRLLGSNNHKVVCTLF